MPSKPAPGAGLHFKWNPGESGIAHELDENWLAISLHLQPSVMSATTTLPAVPSNPTDLYIVPSGANANKLAAYVDGAWAYFTPKVNWSFRVVDQGGTELVFNGLAWEEASGGGGGGGLPEAPLDSKTYGRRNGAWSEVTAGPALATLPDQLLGEDSDTASTPEGVKAFVSQFGFAGNALPLDDLDAVTVGQQFSYNADTLNTPVAGTYGAGFAVAIDGSTYQTQVAIENGTQKLYLRNSNGAGFGPWRLADAPNYLAQLPFLDASNPGGAQMVTGTAFTKVPLYSVTTDNRSGWNGGSTDYTIPEDGLYEVIGSIRPVRSGTGNLPANAAIAVGVGLASAMADSKNVNWAHAIGSAELGVEVHRLIRFTAGQIVCLFGRHTHTAGVGYVFAGLQIRKVSD